MTFEIPLYILAGLIFIGRIFIQPRLVNIPTVTGSYEAIAHMVVGFMLFAPWYDPKEVLGPSWTYFVIGWIISFWELGWFLIQRNLSKGE